MNGDGIPIAAQVSRDAGAPARFVARAEAFLVVATVIALSLKFMLAYRINVHWDEFYFLSIMHDYLRGTLDARFQTFHVHFFSWLADLGSDETGQIIAARLVLAALAAGSALLIYGIARRFVARDAALFSVLVYLSLTVVVVHGASFRTDPIATFLVLLALFSALRAPSRAIGAAAAGAAMGVAALFTIKSVLYLPVIAALIWCTSARLGDRARTALVFSIALALTFGSLYLIHDASLASPPQVAAPSYLGGAASKVLLEEGLVPRWRALLVVMGANPLFWTMAAMGGFVAWRTARRTGRLEDWLPLALALPVLTPLFYRNAFAYYYVFALPSASVLVALFYERHRQKASVDAKSPAVVVMSAVIVAHCALLAVHFWRNQSDEIAPQRRVLAAIHTAFPQPTPYIDGYGVIATFPRHGFFMSSWGMQNYQEAGKPFYPGLVASTQAPLLLADSPSLFAALIPGVSVIEERRLLPEDVRFLQENYVQHWGMLFVAGKKLRPPMSGSRIAFETAIAGDYRLESAVPVDIDGGRLQPGDVVTLGTGEHWFETDQPVEEAILRWAKAMPAPDDDPVGLLKFFAAER